MDRLMVFSLIFSIAYVCAYYFNLSLFEYYPLTNEISFHAEINPNEQTVHLFGWIASAALFGVAASIIIPRRWSMRIPPDLLWAVTLVLIVAILMYERRWFF